MPDPEVRKNIAKAMDYGKSKGLPIGVANEEILQKHGLTKDSGPVFYSHSEYKIFINPWNEFWENPEKVAKEEAEYKYWPILEAGTEIVSAMEHEIGHLRHQLAMGKDYLDPILRSDDAFDVEEIVRIEKEVGGYAATNPLEFVAEIQAGVALKKKYSPEIWEIYNKFHGPKIEMPWDSTGPQPQKSGQAKDEPKTDRANRSHLETVFRENQLRSLVFTLAQQMSQLEQKMQVEAHRQNRNLGNSFQQQGGPW